MELVREAVRVRQAKDNVTVLVVRVDRASGASGSGA